MTGGHNRQEGFWRRIKPVVRYNGDENSEALIVHPELCGSISVRRVDRLAVLVAGTV